jgi:DNA-binding XRE family transcriptional regulator
MNRSEVRSRLAAIREGRLWTQRRLAHEAALSPTTVSGIESGKISRPHFATIRKLAGALGVDPTELLPSTGLAPEGAARAGAPPLSLGWARSSGEAEFEEGLEGATLGGLLALARELGEEEGRLLRLYGEARGAEQRRLIKGRIREVAGQQGSVEASIAHHPDLELPAENRSPGE